MKNLTLMISLLFFHVGATATDTPLSFPDPNLQNRYLHLLEELRCLVCQGQSVYDSDSEFAESLKLVINNKIEQGFSEEQIYSFLADKYGQWILYDPKFNKNTYFLWFLPLLIFLFGGAIIFKKLIKIKK